jgi:lipopolysaccharide/colanic/teichoic acid biosynthesis glycosyltransferase
VIGTLEELPDLLDEHRIGEVIFAEPALDNDRVADFLLATRRSPVDVKMLSGFSDILTLRAKVEDFLDLPVVVFEREAMQRAAAGLKRAADIAGSALLIVLWAPFLALAALASGVRGTGAPLRALQMVGHDMVRFRMMAPKPEGSGSALRRFLASRGLDACPQLLNVLRGDMSFVGPRPLTVEAAERLSERARVRMDARPGITGPARIALSDAARSGREVSELEAYYVQSWSLGTDLVLLMRWLGRCVSGRCRRGS